MADRFPKALPAAAVVPVPLLVALERWTDVGVAIDLLAPHPIPGAAFPPEAHLFARMAKGTLNTWACMDGALLVRAKQTDLVAQLWRNTQQPNSNHNYHVARSCAIEAARCPDPALLTWVADFFGTHRTLWTQDVSILLVAAARHGLLPLWTRLVAQESLAPTQALQHGFDLIGVMAAVGTGGWASGADQRTAHDALDPLIRASKMDIKQLATFVLEHTVCPPQQIDLLDLIRTSKMDIKQIDSLDQNPPKTAMMLPPDPTSPDGQRVLAGCDWWLAHGAEWTGSTKALHALHSGAQAPWKGMPLAGLLERSGFSLAWADAARERGADLSQARHHVDQHDPAWLVDWARAHKQDIETPSVGLLVKGMAMGALTDLAPWVARGARPLRDEPAIAALVSSLWTDAESWVDTRAHPEQLAPSETVHARQDNAVLRLRPWPSEASVRRGTTRVRSELARWGIAGTDSVVRASWGRVLYPEQAAFLCELSGTRPTASDIAEWLEEATTGVFGPTTVFSVDALRADPMMGRRPRMERLALLVDWAIGAGVDVTGPVDARGDTLLHRLAWVPSRPTDPFFQRIVGSLVRAGADPLAVNKSGKTMDQISGRSLERQASWAERRRYLNQYVTTAQVQRSYAAAGRPSGLK